MEDSIGSGEACGAGLTDVESSHRLSKPILDVKIQTDVKQIMMIHCAMQ